MYDPLVRLCPLRSHSILDRRRKQIRAIQPNCPDLELIDTSDHIDPATSILNPKGLKPDISAYEVNSGRTSVTESVMLVRPLFTS